LNKQGGGKDLDKEGAFKIKDAKGELYRF